MSDSAPALDLLKQGVPLALLFDLAGYGPTSEELYRTEGTRVEIPSQRDMVAVAS